MLSLSSLLLNSSRLDRRLDNDLITSARRADVSLLARPTHACTCYCKFPGNQGRGQPVWSWAAATVRSAILATAWLLVSLVELIAIITAQHRVASVNSHHHTTHSIIHHVIRNSCSPQYRRGHPTSASHPKLLQLETRSDHGIESCRVQVGSVGLL